MGTAAGDRAWLGRKITATPTQAFSGFDYASQVFIIGKEAMPEHGDFARQLLTHC